MRVLWKGESTWCRYVDKAWDLGGGWELERDARQLDLIYKCLDPKIRLPTLRHIFMHLRIFTVENIPPFAVSRLHLDSYFESSYSHIQDRLNLPPVLLNQGVDWICIVGHQVRASEILQLQTFCLITVVQNFVNKARFLKQLQFLATASDHRSIDSALIYAILQSFCGINSCTSGTSWWKFLSIMLPVTLLWIPVQSYPRRP